MFSPGGAEGRIHRLILSKRNTDEVLYNPVIHANNFRDVACAGSQDSPDCFWIWRLRALYREVLLFRAQLQAAREKDPPCDV